MRKSLFALENDGEVGDVEMSVSPEEGQIADAGNEVGDDLGEITEVAEAVNTGADAGEQLGEVEALVEDAVENGDGLSPVAAEAVRISVEAICARIGANPRAVYSLYATENFQSASSRKANSRIALEGVGEFLKNLYEKIKAALKNMWTKIKEFWNKHISTLGRVKKALEAMKTKVTSSSGKIKGSSQMEEAPSSLVNAFAGKGAINTTAIDKFIKAHVAMVALAADTSEKISDLNKVATAKVNSFDVVTALNKLEPFTLGSSAEPLIGGVWIDYDVEKETDTDKVTVTVTRETIDEKETKRSLIIADKGDVKAVLDSTLKIINDTIKSKDLSDKAEDASNKYFQALGKAIDKFEKDFSNLDIKSRVETRRRQLSQIYALNSKLGVVPVEMMLQNIRLAKAVMGYASVCLKNYK